MSRGYPGGRIYGITQTHDGYLWIGTDRGLVRFDGSVFRVFRQTGPNRTPIDSVFALAGDSQGNLLISTQGLQRLRLRSEELEELPRLPGQPEDPLSAIYQEHNGTILIATVRRGLVAYDGRSFTSLQGTRPDITAAVRARDGTFWMGTALQGLFAYPDRRLPAQLEDLRHVKINALLPFGAHGFRVGTNQGLLQWDGASAPGQLFGPTHIQTMLEDRQGDLWVGSTLGLCRMGSENATRCVAASSPDPVTSLYEDREGDVWAGTSNGVVRLRQRILTTYPLDAASGGSGGALFADERGAVWCARPNLGLVRIAGGRSERVLATGDYTSLAGSGQNLWLGQKDGGLLDVKVAAANAQARKDGRLDHPIIALFQRGAGALWAGLQNAGVAEIANGHTVLHSNAAGLHLNTVTAIEQTQDGVMWFATASGIASLANGEWRSFTARDGVPPGRINCILADGSGVLWVGADQGLGRIEKGKAYLAAANQPLLHEPIFGIAVDRDDFLWILTSNHVLRVERGALLNDGAGSVFVRQFGVHDGLPAISPSRTSRSITTDAGGRIWMSLGNTLVMADPSALRQPSPPTHVQFQQVSADDRQLQIGERVSIPAGSQRTVIRFAGLNLAAPDRVRFRYRLAGFDRDWSEPTAGREATYTNLAPGSYRFEVRASNIDGLWNEAPAGIALYVEPTLWQTLWFRTSAALSICAIGFAAYQLRLRAVQQQWNLRFQERLDERTRIARELHDTLLQSFHGLILRFQAVRDMLPEEPDAAGVALGSAIDQAAAAITEGRDAVQALRGEEECDDLGESLATVDREFRDEMRGTQPAGVDTSYRVLVEGTPRRLHPVVRDDLYRIAREAVRNAFRHAQAKQIELDIRYDDGALRLRVRDDGSGIDPQVLTSGRRKGHYGLPGMRERATSIGGQFEIWSELRRGTEIEVTIPGMIAYARFEDSGNAGLY
ncbi:two-component regulator propeller domain-containing protein [uncultured Paludibaculum sp.]|uniref:sensor histidine kinase n=1 Tax=uncultured Paludibaculum sp. TaxID=1765020 RepID=UPI002AABED1B|nr:two-component regulator propeller domain-containing protein [uncultured Paludibaculum sp.]